MLLVSCRLRLEKHTPKLNTVPVGVASAFRPSTWEVEAEAGRALCVQPYLVYITSSRSAIAVKETLFKANKPPKKKNLIVVTCVIGEKFACVY